MNTLRALLCYIIRHKYRITRRINASIHELHCTRCGEEFAINTAVKALLPLDLELRQLHEEILNDKKTNEAI